VAKRNKYQSNEKNHSIPQTVKNGVAEHHAGEGSGKAVPLLKAIFYRKALALS
jgi:hypothetical protein